LKKFEIIIYGVLKYFLLDHAILKSLFCIPWNWSLSWFALFRLLTQQNTYLTTWWGSQSLITHQQLM
jgi:hypothetical protein